MAILRSTFAYGVLCAALAACSGKSSQTEASGSNGSTGGAASDGGMGGAATGGAPFVSATHPPLPQVLAFGGPVLKAPKVQPIAYPSDPGLTDVENFLEELASTTYWADATSEYGVGALTVLPTIMLTDPAPTTITDAQVQQELVMGTVGVGAPWGAADKSTIYLFLIPPGTIISDPGGSGCTDYDGYHDEAAVTGAISVPYAISCSCPGFDGPGITDIQERTVAISHELVEAATDPFPNTNPAYAQEDDADLVWTVVSGGEVADMCEFNEDSYVVPPGSTYMVQRSWSNKAAKAGTNPCVPVVTTTPYFNSYPELGMVSYNPGFQVTTQGIKIPVGQTQVVPIQLSSTGPMSGPWKVSVADYSSYINGGAPRLGLTLDQSSGQNGDTLHLTITVKSADPTLGGEAFVLFSTFGKAGQPDYETNLSFGVVTN